MEIEFDSRADAAGLGPQAWVGVLERAVDAVSKVEPALANPRLCLSAVVIDDGEMRALNRQWRGKDKPTNVLSFPQLEPAQLRSLAAKGPPVMLGDIVFSASTLAREAEQKAIALQDHLAHLAVHGLLHLAGHDHEGSQNEAEAMESLERAALARMGVADPYAQGLAAKVNSPPCDGQADPTGNK